MTHIRHARDIMGIDRKGLKDVGPNKHKRFPGRDDSKDKQERVRNGEVDSPGTEAWVTKV